MTASASHSVSPSADSSIQPAPATVAQALFAWTTSDLVNRETGFGLAAVSPSVTDDDHRWIETNFPALTRFVGENVTVTDEERGSWRPRGRELISGRAVIYRKRHTGRSADGRSSRYRVLALIGRDAATPSLIDLLTLTRSSVWHNLNPSEPDFETGVDFPALTDLAIDTLERTLPDTLDTPRSAELPKYVSDLVRGDQVDVLDWEPVDLLAVAATLPEPLRAGLTLEQTWNSLGRQCVLRLTDQPQARRVEGGPSLPPLPQPLRRQAALLASVTALSDARSALFPPPTPASSPVPPTTSVPATRKAAPQHAAPPSTAGPKSLTTSPAAAVPTDPLDALVDTWLAQGLPARQRAELWDRSADVLALLKRTHRTMPATERIGADRPDPLAIGLLRRTPPAEWKTLAAVLPDTAQARAALVSAAPTDAAMIALCARNADSETAAVPSVSGHLSATWPQAVLNAARADGMVRRGLIATVDAASRGDGTTWFVVMCSVNTDDPEFWFTSIVKAAAADDIEVGMQAAALNPYLYARWAYEDEYWQGVQIAFATPDVHESVLRRLLRLLALRRR